MGEESPRQHYNRELEYAEGIKYWDSKLIIPVTLLVECVIPQVAVYGNKLQMQMMLMANKEHYIGITRLPPMTLRKMA